MKQYLNLLEGILKKGEWKEPARENMPKTLSLFGTKMEFDMEDGFPLLTTKKMYHKGIITELIWFLKGDTNIKYLVDNGCNIWNQDAYRWYLKKMKALDDKFYNNNRWFPIELSEFIKIINEGDLESSIPDYNFGDLGKVYGYQWRGQNGIDQIAELIKNLKETPYSRYHIVDGWNKVDFKDMALPPCHLLYQFDCRKLTGSQRLSYGESHRGLDGSDYSEFETEDLNFIADQYYLPKYTLDLQMNQRSCDSFLGVPFNIASASLLLHIIAKAVNMKPGKFIWIGGDTHVYENHIDQVKEQMLRQPKKLSTVIINKEISSLEDIENLSPEDIEVVDYKSHPAIKGKLSAGL